MRITKLLRDNWLLVLILLISALLRLYKLGSIPPHLTPDEASLGYNAYSILKTGKDEYGTLLPIIFKSFGDFKPGLYIYTAVPSIAILGLNEFSTRLPSAIAGIVAVFLIYKIISLALSNKKLSLVSAFFLTLSPWHIQLSRGAWEVNLSATLTLAGVYFFIRSLKEQNSLVWSAIFFALTMLAYQGAKLSTAIVLLILLLIYRKHLFKIPKFTIAKSILAGAIILIPVVLSLFTGKAGRLGVFSVLNYPRPEQYLQDFLDQGNEKVGDASYYLFHSESYNFFRGIMGRFFNHFSAKFLFFTGDWSNPRHTAPNHGVLLLVDVLFLATGFFALIKSKANKFYYFILLWLVLAPLPAILSRDQVHAVRSFNMVFPIVIICSIGFRYILSLSKGVKIAIAGFSVVGLVLSIVYFLDAYFIHMPVHNAKYWEYGYKQIVETVTPIQNNYQQVKVQQSYSQPYIYFLFYQKYDPVAYQKEARLKESEYGDVGQVEQLDNICFCAIDWSVNRGEKGVLFVADPVRIPPEDSKDENQFSVIREIKYPKSADTAFRVVEVKL